MSSAAYRSRSASRITIVTPSGSGSCRSWALSNRSANSRWASAGLVPASTRSTTNRNRSSSSREYTRCEPWLLVGTTTP